MPLISTQLLKYNENFEIVRQRELEEQVQNGSLLILDLHRVIVFTQSKIIIFSSVNFDLLGVTRLDSLFQFVGASQGNYMIGQRNMIGYSNGAILVFEKLEGTLLGFVGT
jgi:hypothetical protein